MNFATILATVKLIFSMIPIILTAMKAIEEAAGHLPGVQKLEIVRIGLKAAYDAHNDVADAFDDVWPTFEALIAKLKASDLFKATTPPAK
jgi:hypothetical protein